jgi:hypothetical protein
MNWKTLFAVATLVVLIYSPTWVPAATRTIRNTGMTREEIKAKPIETRPFRAGHVYGNAVRRQANR